LTVVSLSEDLAFRGLVHQVTDEAVFKRLDAGAMTVYAGFDPSAPSLGVHHLMQLCTLRRFQLAGHRPIVVAGGGTGMVGDPGGKTTERPMLSEEQLAANLTGIEPQLRGLLDFSPGAHAALLLDNAAWLKEARLIEFLREVGSQFTVNQMIAKEAVRSRIERPEQGISYTEFSYMLLQAYDFLRLHVDYGCELQIGGSDQWGNITMGVELVRKVCGDEVFGLTTPLVTKPDGTKFGKTEAGTVWLDPARTSPYQLYQFFLNTEDASVGAYLRYFTFLPPPAIEELDHEVATAPGKRVAQRALARAVCTLVHGERETRRCEAAAAALFGDGDIAALDEETLRRVVAEVPSSTVPRTLLGGKGASVTDLLVMAGVTRSRAEAVRLVEQGGISLNGKPVRELRFAVRSDDLLHGRFLVLRRGRRDYHVLCFE